MAEAKKIEAKKYKVNIAVGGDKEDSGDVFLGVNGRTVLIKRGCDVVIDECFVEALKHSKIDTHVKGENDKLVAVQIPRFNFSVEPA